MIHWRAKAGALAAFGYNHGVGKAPPHNLRKLYLSIWLGSMGKNCAVQMNCRFLHGRNIHLGARNIINFGCLFDGRKYEIRTGANVSIGPEAAILTLGHDPESLDFSDQGGPVTIGDHVWIAYRAIILPGVTIGVGAVVGAGSVVTQDVAPYTIVAGAPAKAIGQRPVDLRYRLNQHVFLT